MRSRTLLAAACAAIALALPASAHGVSVTVTGDDGGAVALSEGSQPTIRQMSPKITATFAASEKRYTLRILDPAQQEDPLSVRCGDTANTDATRAVRYSGNGTYTLTFTTYANDNDFYCEQGGQTQTFRFVVNAFTRLTPPGTTILYRSSGLGFKDPVFRYELNPGATGYTIFYAFDAKLGPDGGIAGEYARDDYGQVGVGVPTGSQAVSFKHAGIVTMVARAHTSSGASAYSPPLVLTIVSPFDFGDTPGLSDPKGPSYAVRGKVSEKLAAGETLTMSMAKGKGAFRKVATSKIGADGGFLFKFKQRRKGSYRVRYDFKGSRFMTAGAWTQKLSIKSRVVSLDSLKHLSGD